MTLVDFIIGSRTAYVGFLTREEAKAAQLALEAASQKLGDATPSWRLLTHHQQQAYNDEGAASRITSRILANDEKRRDLSERKKRTSFAVTDPVTDDFSFRFTCGLR